MKLKNKQLITFWKSKINPITGWKSTVFVDRNLIHRKEREYGLSAVEYVAERKRGIYFNIDAEL
tara:strand:- start:4 stop:195 length:192 start_codon:yes stop_codon:yes gene_type:complete